MGNKNLVHRIVSGIIATVLICFSTVPSAADDQRQRLTSVMLDQQHRAVTIAHPLADDTAEDELIRRPGAGWILHQAAPWLVLGLITSVFVVRRRHRAMPSQVLTREGTAAPSRKLALLGSRRGHDVDHFSRHIDTMPLAVVELNCRGGARGKITTWSRQAVRIFGWPEQAALGRTLDDLGLIDDADQPRRAALYRAMREGSVDAAEITVQAWTRNRRPVHCTAHISVARGDHGAVDAILMIVKDVTDDVEAKAKIVHRAHHDALTGLPNRNLFQEHLLGELNRISGTGERIAVMLIDLDKFKQVNDSYGHVSGDELLRQVGERLRRTRREVDLPARLGGDEFALVHNMAGDSVPLAQAAAQVLEEIGQPVQVDGHRIEVACSIGVAVFPDDAGDAEALLRVADVALYHAKAAGRNRLSIYQKVMDQAMTRDRCVQSSLLRALAEEKVELVYQPIMPAKARSLEKVEASCRWREPDGAHVAPPAILQAAESCGVDSVLFGLMLHAACKDALAWQAVGSPLTITLPVGSGELLRPDFVRRLDDALSTSGIAPRCLQLAISEAAVSECFGSALIGRVRDVSGLGIGLTISNFGAGHLPLTDLPRLAIDEIKVGRSLVRRIHQDDSMAAVAKSIAAMAQGLGLRAVAADVGIELQRLRLFELGYDAVQGDAVAPPFPADAMLNAIGDARATYTHALNAA